MDSCDSSESAVFALENRRAEESSLESRNLLGSIPFFDSLLYPFPSMTYVTDPIGDLLTRMRNAQHARKGSCTAPWSRIKQELCEVLKREKWIEDVKVNDLDGVKKEIEVVFGDKILELKRVSKPGRRMYSRSTDLVPVLRGYGMAIITTSSGLMTDKEAREKKVGGEILCTVA